MYADSVIYDALLRGGQGQPFERLKFWCTVGAPFLDYQPNRLLFNRLGNMGLTFYAMAIGALLFTVELLAIYFLGNSPLWDVVHDTIGQNAFLWKRLCR